MQVPTVACCITCKGRAEHIKRTLPANLEDNPDAKFILLNYNSGDDLVEYVTEHHQSDLVAGRLVLYSTFEPERFQMAHAKNMAHRLGIEEGGDILVNLDADNYAGRGFVHYLRREFGAALRRGAERYMWARMVKGQMDRGISGRIAVTRNAFLLTGGYDEKYDTWGPDDEDFKTRLGMLGIESGEIDPSYLHAVRHPDKARFREYPEVEGSAYGEGAKCSPTRAIVNFGNVGLGNVCRNVSGKKGRIRPIPTRIFGIGMHKTGTTSLAAAFGILGFNAAHWGTALWARRVWEQVKGYGPAAEVDAHYAFSDLPFTLLFRELDKAYPGSKFILTVRPEDEWLKSVEKHWDPAINPHRKDWEIAPFTHRLHHLVYGRKTFDADIFLRRYRAHNREVSEYFKDRPGDLLTYRIGDGWPNLCNFLGRKIPSVAYPHELSTCSYPQKTYVSDFSI
jgi:hypothetical protein